MQKNHPADTITNFEKLDNEYHVNVVTGELLTNDEYAKRAIEESLEEPPVGSPKQAYA